jgi:type IV secretory pathway TrbL component
MAGEQMSGLFEFMLINGENMNKHFFNSVDCNTVGNVGAKKELLNACFSV